MFHRFEFVLTQIGTYFENQISDSDSYIQTQNPLYFKTQHLRSSQLKHLLKQAVHKRLQNIQHGKIAFLLSGGLDSSMIVALARELYPNTELLTFSIDSKKAKMLQWLKK